MYKSQHFFFITVKWIQLKNCFFTGNFYTHWIYIVLFREWVEYILALNTCHFFFFIFIYKELKFQSYNVWSRTKEFWQFCHSLFFQYQIGLKEQFQSSSLLMTPFPVFIIYGVKGTASLKNKISKFQIFRDCIY